VAAHDDDLLRAEALGGDDAAEPNGPVADDRDALSGFDLCDDRRVVAGAQDVRQRQERWHELMVFTDGQRESVPSAYGTRSASACAPFIPLLPKKPA
jgi:hypothetical protein